MRRFPHAVWSWASEFSMPRVMVSGLVLTCLFTQAGLADATSTTKPDSPPTAELSVVAEDSRQQTETDDRRLNQAGTRGARNRVIRARI